MPTATKPPTATRETRALAEPTNPAALAPATRSGRETKTADTTRPLMIPSPIPMSAWTPTIAPRTVDTGTPPEPPIAYSPVNAADAATTDIHDATAVAATTDVAVVGSRRITRRNTPHPTSAVTSAMLITLRPSAETPPSAKTRHCTTTTTATTTAPTQGPSRIATRAPPRRCPDVPAATGKFSICSAKTKAAASPASGTTRSLTFRLILRRLTPTPPVATAAADRDVGRSMSPSGMCIGAAYDKTWAGAECDIPFTMASWRSV